MTPLGHLMAEFPLDPMLTKMLVSSVDFECSNEILTLVAMLSVPYCYYRPRDKQTQADDKLKKFIHEDGDHLTLINVYNEFINSKENTEWCFKNFLSFRNLKSAVSIRSQLANIMVKCSLRIHYMPSNNSLYSTMVRKSILAGYFTQVAHLQKSGNYMVVRDNQVVAIHPGSLFNAKPTFVIYHELVLTTKNFIRTACGVKPEWLLIEAGSYFNPSLVKNIETRKELEKAEAGLIKDMSKNGHKQSATNGHAK